jgi:hypothetical protein
LRPHLNLEPHLIDVQILHDKPKLCHARLYGEYV